MSAALGIALPDDHKLLANEAFRLQPCVAVGLVLAIGAFRHDAFEAVLAGQPMERWAVADLMIVVSK